MLPTLPPEAGAWADQSEPLPLAEVGSKLARAWHRIHELESNLDQHRAELDRQLRSLAEAHDRLARSIPPEQAALVHGQLDRWHQTLHDIYSSDAWIWISRYYRVRNRLLPPGSRRRLAAATLVRPLKRLLRTVRRLPTASPVPAAALAEKPTEAQQHVPQAPASGFLEATDEAYAQWIADNEPSSADLDRQRASHFTDAPLFSLLLDACEGTVNHLWTTLASIADQTYSGWELCVVVQAESGLAHVLDKWRALNSRTKVVTLPAGHRPEVRANAALAVATGTHVAVLEMGDALAPFALFEVARTLLHLPDADFLYSDEDRLEGTRLQRTDHHFKPDWSPDTLRSHNYVGQLAIFAYALVRDLGGFREGLAGAHNYDLILRATERARRIVHIPQVLYHQRSDPAGKAHRENEDVASRALEDHLRRTGAAGTLHLGVLPGTYQITYEPTGQPLVSVIIPNRDNADLLKRSVASVLQGSYANTEILIVENGSQRASTFACYSELTGDPRVRVLSWDKPFNFAAINNEAVRSAAGAALLFLNNDVQAINVDWLERMLDHALRRTVGAVGAKLYYSDDTIQHAGMLVGRDHGPCHQLLFCKRGEAGYARRLATVQNVSVVTGACLMTRRKVFEEVGGFDEHFVIAYNDVDLCLQMRRHGYLNVWTPHAELYHFESVTRGFDDTPEKAARHQREDQRFRERWADRLPRVDPYYNPNLTLGRPDGSLCKGKAEKVGEEAILL